MFGLSRLYVGLIGAGIVASFILYQGYSWGRASQEAKLAQQQAQILTLHQAIKDMTTAAKEQQQQFNELLRNAREASGPIEDENEPPKNKDRAPADKSKPVSRVPDRFKNSAHCRDC